MSELNPDDYYLNLHLTWGVENYSYDLRFNMQVFGYVQHILLKNDKPLQAPKYLYKYYRPTNDNLNSLLENYLYFPHPKTFNDPYDCLSHKDNTILNEDYKVHRENLGVCCFTASHDDRKMWGLYTDSYRGFCLKFTNSDKFLPYQESLNIKSHVLYLKKYIEKHPNFEGAVEIIDSKINHTKEFKIWMKDFITYYYQYCWKSQDWSYEKEYRFISLAAQKCNRKISFHSDNLDAIFIGYNMDETYYNLILNIIKAKFPKTKIYRVKPNLSKVKLDFIRI